MAYNGWQATVQDDAGNAIPLAEITVREGGPSGDIATIFADPAGTAKANPFFASASGLAQFFAAPGSYYLTASLDGQTTDGWYVAITSSLTDGFTSRAAFIAALGWPWAVGAVVSDGTVQYEYLGTGTAISDAPGWVPFGAIYPEHFGANTTPGTTDMSPAIQSAILYAETIAPSTSIMEKYARSSKVKFLRGIYGMASGVTVSKSGVVIEGDGENTTAIRALADNFVAFTFAHSDAFNAGGGSVKDVSLFGVGVKNIGFVRSEFSIANGSYVAFILARRCRILIENVVARGHTRAIRLEGCREGSRVNGVVCNSYLGSLITTQPADSYHIAVEAIEVSASDPEAKAGGDSKYYAKSVGIHLTDVDTRERGVSTIYGVQDGLRIGGVDGLYLTNCHIGFGSRSQIAFIPTARDVDIWNVIADGVFLDATVSIPAGLSQYSLYAKSASGSTATMKWVSFSGVRGNVGSVAAVEMDHAGLDGFIFTDFILNGVDGVSGQHGVNLIKGKNLSVSSGIIGSCVGGNYVKVGSAVTNEVNISELICNNNEGHGNAADGVLVESAFAAMTIKDVSIRGITGEPVKFTETTLSSVDISVSGVLHQNSFNVASAATVFVPVYLDVLNLTGTTTLNELEGFWEGRVVHIQMGGAITVQDALTASGNIQLRGRSNKSFALGDIMSVAMIDGVIRELSRKEATALYGAATFGYGTGAPSVTLDGASGQNRIVTFRTAGVNRFIAGMNSTENWRLSRYNASGVPQSDAITIDGSTGLVTVRDLQLLFAAQSSVSPAANGQFAIEATSNTQITLKYRGSDGVTRSIALTVA